MGMLVVMQVAVVVAAAAAATPGGATALSPVTAVHSEMERAGKVNQCRGSR